MAHASRRLYLSVFLVLAVLTALEVGLVYLPGIGKASLVVALVGVAIVKASLVGLFFMHLRHETRALKLTVAVPLMTPGVYALVLVAEAGWRLLR
jgi:cytochrome c oxidase subunit 4